jgi:ribulose-phosphate 3-epimerase
LKAVRIAPSILAGDMGNLRHAVEQAVEGGADLIHLDVIDGHFAPNITFGPGTIKSLRNVSSLPFDAHLMINDPLTYAERFLDAGCDTLTVHAEVIDGRRFTKLLRIVRARGKRIGLALKPSTPLPVWAHRRLSDLDVLLIMTVNPGFSGQTLDPRVLPKLQELSGLASRVSVDTEIEVDGGVDLSNASEVVKRGANILVAGAAVYGTPDPIGAIRALRESCSA